MAKDNILLLVCATLKGTTVFGGNAIFQIFK